MIFVGLLLNARCFSRFPWRTRIVLFQWSLVHFPCCCELVSVRYRLVEEERCWTLLEPEESVRRTLTVWDWAPSGGQAEGGWVHFPPNTCLCSSLVGSLSYLQFEQNCLVQLEQQLSLTSRSWEGGEKTFTGAWGALIEKKGLMSDFAFTLLSVVWCCVCFFISVFLSFHLYCILILL